VYVQIGSSNSNAVNFTLSTNQTPSNQAPVVNAGPGQTITLPSGASLSGTATDDGLPSGTLTSTWSAVSGPGSVTFGNAAALSTTAAFSASGTYTLRLTASDSALSSSADVVITVNPASSGTNQAPVVNAGPDQTVTLSAGASLSGTATDDGLPKASLSTAWSVVSGPGTVTFANAWGLNTTAAFSAAGTYTLRLSASDTALLSTDDKVITVGSGTATNQPPVVNAGPDQTITSATATLSGTATDDGLPNGTLTKGWSKVSGPGTVTFANAGAPSTTATFSTTGTYTLRLTASDGALSSVDDVVIVMNACGVAVPASVAVMADATDNVGVVGVQFKLDGANFGPELTAAPYSMTWDTTTAANGCHVLAAVARDAAGNQGTSSLTASVSHP